MRYYLVLLFLIITQTANANLIINELLSNEPGQSTSLEWIELYNNSESPQQLADYTIVLNSKIILLPTQILEPHSYIIVCKNLFSADSEVSFESYWGNGSNVWGDSEYETTTSEPIEASFSLLNDSGTVLLMQHENIVSSFRWEEKGEDGISWERKFVDSAIIAQSKSTAQSTPGYLNSITLVQKDLAVESVSVVMENFIPLYTFTIANRGQTDIDDCVMHIYDSTLTTLLNSYSVSLVPSDSIQKVEIALELLSEQMYESLVAVVATPSDVRSSNDSLSFIAVSSSYPPILISEFLANPQGTNQTEWIEIYNRSLEDVDLQNWFIGDALNVYPMTLEPFFIAPNQYIVLTKSVNDFLIENSQFDGIAIELEKWAVLNNDVDKIRLVDVNDIEADNYSYSTLYDDNYTVSRELNSNLYQWGRTSEPNGTPGYKNDLFETHNRESVYINLSSKYISPDGDGFEDKVIIDIDVPQSSSYTLKLYDINGNIVKTFFSDRNYIPNQLEWDGLSDNNARLPIGIYILYLTTKEGISTKETIVIAR